MDEQSGIERACTKAGGQAALGTELGVAQQQVWTWVQRGYVPLKYVKPIADKYGIEGRALLDPRLLDAVSDTLKA